MADILALGGSLGDPLVIPAVPDSTFETEIAALVVAKTKVVGKLVALTFSNNYEVTSPAAGAEFDGEIISYDGTTAAAGSGYLLTVVLLSYIDQNSARHTPVCVRELEYAGTLALQDSAESRDANYRTIVDGGTGGWGAVLALDTTNSLAHVLF